jgi:hypothetical protein
VNANGAFVACAAVKRALVGCSLWKAQVQMQGLAGITDVKVGLCNVDVAGGKRCAEVSSIAQAVDVVQEWTTAHDPCACLASRVLRHSPIGQELLPAFVAEVQPSPSRLQVNFNKENKDHVFVQLDELHIDVSQPLCGI